MEAASRRTIREQCDAVDSDCDGSYADEFDDNDGDDDPDCNDEDDDDDGDPDTADCDPFDPAFHAAATELCDDLDSDCDGSLVDEFADSDGDGDPNCLEVDADDDGLLDFWELTHGLDPTDPSDATSDADADGRDAELEETDGTDPNVYDGPSAPSTESPVDGFRPPTLTPELVAGNAISPVGDALTYAFEVYSDESLTDLLAWTEGVQEGVDVTSWTVDVELTEDQDGWWRVAASNAYVQGAWSEPALFAPDTHGKPIDPLTPLFPVWGDDMEEGDAFQWGSVISLDGLPIRYVVALLDEYGVEVLNEAPVEHEPDALEQSWHPPGAFGLQPGLRYSWQVRAIDTAGRESDPSPFQGFGYRTGNDPPSDPAFLAPLDQDRVEILQPTLSIGQGVDPEGGEVNHTVRLDTSSAFDSADAMVFSFEDFDALSTAGPGTFDIDLAAQGIELIEETWYFASVVGVDLVELDSAEELITFYVAGGNDPPSPPVLLGPDPDLAQRAQPTLEVAASVDPEGDPITYEFKVSRDADLSDEGAQGREVDALIWTVESPLSGGYWWSARAIDDRGAASDWAEPWPLVAVDPTWGSSCSVGEGGGPWLLLLFVLGLRRRR